MPSRRVSRKCPIPGPFPDGPQTFGDHIKAKRLEERLTHGDLGKKLGVSPWTILNWEKNRTVPPIGLRGRTVDYLGYDPGPKRECETLKEHMASFRQLRGFSQEKAADEAGVDESSWQAWESGRRKPTPLSEARLRRFLGIPAEPDSGDSFGERLRAARLAKGLSQRDLGLLLGVHTNTVRSWELGHNIPSNSAHERIAGCFPDRPHDEQRRKNH